MASREGCSDVSIIQNTSECHFYLLEEKRGSRQFMSSAVAQTDRIKQIESKHVKFSHLTIQHLKFKELRVTFIMPCNMF